MASDDRGYYLAEDARDRRAALAFAQAFVYGVPQREDFEWPPLAEEAYRWLQRRDSLRAVSLQLTAGTPFTEGKPAMTTTFDLSDTDEVVFSLTGLDAKGASVPAPSDTWSWTLADPDDTGAVLTVSEDTTTATVAAGVPDSNLMLSVAGASTGLQGAEAIIVQASAATTVGMVASNPTAEAPAAG